MAVASLLPFRIIVSTIVAGTALIIVASPSIVVRRGVMVAMAFPSESTDTHGVKPVQFTGGVVSSILRS